MKNARIALVALAILASPAVAHASDVYVNSFGIGNSIAVEQEAGNAAGIYITGSGNDTNVYQIGRGADLDLTIFADSNTSHVVTGLCPRGRSTAPVVLTDDGALDLVVTRCR